jgi:predicted nucleotidyltransferase
MARTKEDFLELIRSTPFMWPDSIIHTFMGGSAMHGATGNKPADIDILGVYIQPVELILGIPQKNEDGKAFDPDVQIWKPNGDNARTQAGEADLNLYSLRKWANMAATGNTTALEFLFVDNLANDPFIWNLYIKPNAQHFISKRAGFHFKEFAKAMKLRLSGGNTGKHGQRPELEAEFGYDVKGAMHMLRVLGEGIEMMRTGEIILPRPEAPFLKDVRNGKHTWEEVNEIAEARFRILDEQREASFLPDELNRAKISAIITQAQLDFWGLQ